MIHTDYGDFTDTVVPVSSRRKAMLRKKQLPIAAKARGQIVGPRFMASSMFSL
jgi:hypothetical protein